MLNHFLLPKNGIYEHNTVNNPHTKLRIKIIHVMDKENRLVFFVIGVIITHCINLGVIILQPHGVTV